MPKFIKFLFLSFYTCCLPSLAIAADGDAELNRNTVLGEAFADGGLGGGGLGADNILQVFIALVLIIVFIVVLAIILRKMNLVNGKNSALINILGGISLSSKDRLLLIQVGEEQILISASPGSIQKIHQLSTPVDTQSMSDPETRPKNNFSSLLSSLVSKQSS